MKHINKKLPVVNKKRISCRYIVIDGLDDMLRVKPQILVQSRTIESDIDHYIKLMVNPLLCHRILRALVMRIGIFSHVGRIPLKMIFVYVFLSNNIQYLYPKLLYS